MPAQPIRRLKILRLVYKKIKMAYIINTRFDVHRADYYFLAYYDTFTHACTHASSL